MGTFGCPFHEPNANLAAECKDRIAGTVAAIQQIRPAILFVTNSSGSDDREAMISDLIEKVEASAGKIVYLMPPPAEKVLEDCYSKISSPADCITRVDSKWSKQASWERAQAERRGWIFIASDDWFCVNGSCPAFAGNIVAKKDLHHATPAYQDRIGTVMTERLNELKIFN